MNIQSISIVVPTPRCINDCKFCVSKMHDNAYNLLYDKAELRKRIKYAVMNGVTTCILTGIGEVLQNKPFLENLTEIFNEMDYPFPNVELQTTGVMLELKNEMQSKDFPYTNMNLLKKLGVNTISLSVSDIFSDEINNEIIGIPKKLRINLAQLISFIKKFNMNVRLSLNMTNQYDAGINKIWEIFTKAKVLNANQLTFRKLFAEENGAAESLWVNEHKCQQATLDRISYYIRDLGVYLYTLPFGGKVYSINEMSVVLDDDCMSKNSNEALKYLILREDGKLYCRWDDKGSLIF